MSFVHLHLHSEYSLLDGAIRFGELVKHVSSLGMPAVACTDHGFMGGLVEFYKTCRKANLKSLLGVEAYITNDPDGTEQKTRDNMHMVLLAKDLTGYTKLSELTSHAGLHNFFYKPRIYREHLVELRGHVVATSACLAGVLAKLVTYHEDGSCSDPSGQVLQHLDFYRQIFGEDFFLELQVWNDSQQAAYNQFLLELGRKHGLPFIITADCHYLRPEDFKLHELLMAMQLKLTLDEYRAGDTIKYGPDFYVASPEEMTRRALTLGMAEAISNTLAIAERCDVELPLGQYQVPIYNIQQAADYQQYLIWRERCALNGP